MNNSWCQNFISLFETQISNSIKPMVPKPYPLCAKNFISFETQIWNTPKPSLPKLSVSKFHFLVLLLQCQNFWLQFSSPPSSKCFQSLCAWSGCCWRSVWSPASLAKNWRRYVVLSLHHFRFLQLKNVFNHRFYFEIVLRIG